MTDLNKNATSDVRIAAVEHPRLSYPEVEHAPSFHSVSSKSTGLRQRRASGRRRGGCACCGRAVRGAVRHVSAAAGCCAARHDKGMIRSVMFLPDLGCSDIDSCAMLFLREQPHAPHAVTDWLCCGSQVTVAATRQSSRRGARF